MNQQDKIDLSKRVAEKYGIDAYAIANGLDGVYFWLADDDARVFRLAIDKHLLVDSNGSFATAATDGINVIEYTENNEDEYAATRIAILKCLDEMKD